MVVMLVAILRWIMLMIVAGEIGKRRQAGAALGMDQAAPARNSGEPATAVQTRTFTLWSFWLVVQWMSLRP
jgi:hypothetical protein